MVETAATRARSCWSPGACQSLSNHLTMALITFAAQAWLNEKCADKRSLVEQIVVVETAVERAGWILLYIEP
jgi:hypothetical protein